MDGSATLTIDVSSMTTNCADTSRTSAAQRRLVVLAVPVVPLPMVAVSVVVMAGSFAGCWCLCASKVVEWAVARPGAMAGIGRVSGWAG